jgi:adenine-specific DNA methylase
MVLPAELLQVTYAGELREYLARNYAELTVITFRRLIFEGIQQETVLLMGVRSAGGSAEMSFLQLDRADQLDQRLTRTINRVSADLDHAREKWTQYYLSHRELGLIRELERSETLTALGNLAHVDVGIVTGRNEFFVLRPSEAERFGVTEFCLPLVGRSAQIQGLALRADEWADLSREDGKCLLLQLGRTPRSQLSPQALAYVEHGESMGYHTGYKCRIRQPQWWFVPSVAVPDAFMLRQIHDGPRIIANKASATCTDTIHRVRVRSGVDPGWLAGASMNSVTFAFSEIRGRSYGGGVLELEPNEADALPFPVPRNQSSLPLDELDLLTRRKESHHILDEVDRLVLRECGMTSAETALVRGIWVNLSTRRRERKAS